MPCRRAFVDLLEHSVGCLRSIREFTSVLNGSRHITQGQHPVKVTSGQMIVSINPFKCRMWHLHDRAEEHITEGSCRDELESFARFGQLVPVLARPLRDDPTYEIELIFGARRLFVARQLNVPLRVEVREMTDREAIVAMDIENRQRQDISAYERGLSYARWLREGHFNSQDDIANALRVSPSHVSRLLKVARLPAVVVGAFASPAEICEVWGLELAAALDDPERRADTLRKAREIGRGPTRPAAREVCRRLLTTAATGRKPRASARDEVVLSDSGTPLFRMRHERAWLNLRIPADKISVDHLKSIRAALISILHPATRQSLDRSGDRKPLLEAAIRAIKESQAQGETRAGV